MLRMQLTFLALRLVSDTKRQRQVTIFVSPAAGKPRFVRNRTRHPP